MLTRILALVFSLLLMTGLAHADHLTVSGEVTYRERIALPPGSTLYVSLVTLPGGRPVAGAGAAIPAKGQVPLQFSLNVRSDTAAVGGSFGLVAEIRTGTSVIFRNAAAVPVDLASTAPISILVARHSAQTQVEEPAIDPQLIGSTWTVTSIGGRPVVGDHPLTIAIAADLRVDGHAGCNDYSTQVASDGKNLQFDPAAATRKACPPDVMAQESAFFAALAAIGGYERTADSLRLLDAAGIPLIGLVRPGSNGFGNR